MEVLPAPHGSQANPIRGAGLNKCPFIQPAAGAAPTPGNEDLLTPHCTMPLNIRGSVGETKFRVLGSIKPPVLGSIPSSLSGLKTAGSQLNAWWKRSRYVPNRLTRNP